MALNKKMIAKMTRDFIVPNATDKPSSEFDEVMKPDWKLRFPIYYEKGKAIMTTAKAKFGLMEDAFACLAINTPGDSIEIVGYCKGPDSQESDVSVSFLLLEDKALELAKEIVERIETRRKRRALRTKGGK